MRTDLKMSQPDSDTYRGGPASGLVLSTLVVGAVLGLAVCMDSQPRKPHKTSTIKAPPKPPAPAATRPASQSTGVLGNGVLYGLPSSITAITRVPGLA